MPMLSTNSSRKGLVYVHAPTGSDTEGVRCLRLPTSIYNALDENNKVDYSKNFFGRKPI